MKSRFAALATLAAIGAAPSWVASILEALIGLPVSLFALPVTVPISMLAYGAGLAVAYQQAFRGQAWGVGEGLGFSTSKLLPLFGVAFLQGLAITVGACFCIAPGVLAFVAFIAAVPLVLFDNVPVIESFSQSYNLSRGSWLPIFVVFFATSLMLALPMILGVCVLGAGAGLMVGASGESGAESAGWISVLFTLVFAPITVAASAFFNSLYIVVYQALLRRQGRTDEQVIDVFA